MSEEEKEVALEDLYWAILSKNDIIRILKDNCSKNMLLEKQLEIKDKRIAELEEQLKKTLESNNDLLKQIMELQSQLITERLKGENK